MKKMREYSHEEFVELVRELNEVELLDLSANYGGYPVLFRKALDERICHIPFIQTGSSVIVRNNKKEILLQKRADNKKWGLPGGCQDLGEDLKITAVRELYEETGIRILEEDLVLIDIVSGEKRKRIYPNGDIVYNNTTLYLIDVNTEKIDMKKDDESLELKFFNIEDMPKLMHDGDLVDTYICYLNSNTSTYKR